MQWKKISRRKPLMLLGARQVGKTYILREFGKNEFKSMVYVNCHKDSFAVHLFSDPDAVRIVESLERIFETKIEAGSTFVFFDEIQEVDNGVASLKYFCEDCPDLHVAVAGSLLGISLHEGESFPVGKIETLRMYPMSFMEFLSARRRDRLRDGVQSLDWPSLEVHHERLTDYLREYFFVGGMPEAVQEWVNSQDPQAVRAIQAEVLNAYMNDVGKHSKTQSQRIHLVWESIPSQLARENKKFVFGAIRKGARSAEYETAIQWLADAGLINIVRRASKVQKPLKFYAEQTAFKVYMSDVGLLSCMCRVGSRDMLFGNSAFMEFKGSLTENYVLQQIVATTGGNEVYYFSKDNSSQEIDFLMQIGRRVIPIEVKAETNAKSKSLSGFVRVDHADMGLKGLRASMLPYADQGWMENVPLYAVGAYVEKEIQDEYGE